MRYFEFMSISENFDLDAVLVEPRPRPEQADREDALRRLKELNQEQVQKLAIAIHQELACYLPQSQLERFELERRLGC